MNYCKPTGPLNAKIAIVGEAPGREELLPPNIPFYGSSGQLLWEILASFGVTRESVYCTNVIKVSASHQPLASLDLADLELNKTVLRAELSRLDPNVIIALGNTSLWALSDNTIRLTVNRDGSRIIENGISNWRGSILASYDGHKLIPAFHPAYILWNPTELWLLEHDLKLAYNESFFPEIYLPAPQYIIYPTLQVALDYIERCRQAGEFAFDIETQSAICTCISLAHCDTEAISIPLHGKSFWSAQDYVAIYKALNSLLGDPHVNKIGQNISYDINGLAACNIIVRPPYSDIMLIHHAIDPLIPHSLAFQSSIYTRFPFWKEWDIAPSASGVGIDNLYSYNCQDSIATINLKKYYSFKYPERMEFYNRAYAPLQPHLIQMYQDGICIDKLRRSSLANSFYDQGARLNEAVALGLNVPNFNVNSPTATKKVLYDILKLPVQKKRQARGPSTETVDDEALVNLYLQTQNVFILMLRDAKEKLKLASFLEPKSKEAIKKRQTWDGRLRCEFSQNSKTGRLKGSASISTGIGLNLQQIPDIVRSMFVPAPGYIFLEPDYQQAEARAIAWDGQDLDTMHFFELARHEPDKYDIHWRNAEIIMQQPRQSLAKNDRQIAKPIGFGSWYGLSAGGVQRNVLKYTDPPLFIELKECARRQQLFKQNAPNCFDRQERVKHEVLTTGQQISPTGQIWRYPEIITSNLKYRFGRRDYSALLREAYSDIPQNIVAYLTGRAIVEIDTRLRLAQIGRVVLQVHDSILLEVKDNWPDLLQAFKAAKLAMEQPFIVRGNEMIIPSDFKLGFNWQGEVKNIRTEDELLTAYNQIKERKIK